MTELIEKTAVIFKKDTSGNIRVWWSERDGNAYRFCHGIEGGAIVQSGWKYAVGKNVGKANETSDEEQAIFEINSKRTIQLYQGNYHEHRDDAVKGKALFIKPMLAAKYEDGVLPKGHTWPVISQPKLDGLRCLVSIDGMQSRQGKPILGAPHIHDKLVASGIFDLFPDLVLDGELYNHELKEDFQTLVSIARKSKPKPEDLVVSAEKMQYHVYDCITPDDMVLEDRIGFLSNELDATDVIHKVPHYIVNSPEEADEKFAEYLEDGYEGQMLRKPGSTYEQKRSRNLLKHKVMTDAEFKIVEFHEGLGNWAGYAKRVTIMLEDGSTQSCGLRGTQDFLRQVLVEKDEYINGDATVNFFGRTDDGKLRFPVMVKFWKGKRDL